MSSTAIHLRNIKSIGYIILAWLVSMLLYTTVIYFTIDEIDPERSTYMEWITFTIIIAIIIGSINGILEVYVFRNRFTRMKFSLVILSKTALFFAAFIVTAVLYIQFKSFILVPLGIGEKGVEDELYSFFTSSVFYKHGSYTIIMSFIINFLLQINRKMGSGVLLNLFFGRYHSPRQEERIIMFLDLSSATSIAEKLDPQKYSSFLKDFFYDLDAAINETKGAVFQFVGDEVVIIWDIKKGIEDNNCINIFFLAEEKIKAAKNNYIEKYGIYPEFKAGLHYGKVIITEVGGSKSEIAYHGDTINTTARIRSACHEYNEKLLISADLLSLLPTIDEKYKIESKGLSQFKGKENVIALFSVEEK